MFLLSVLEKQQQLENSHPFLYAHPGFEQRRDDLFLEPVGQASCSNCAQLWIVTKRVKEQNYFPQLPEIHSLGKMVS